MVLSALPISRIARRIAQEPHSGEEPSRAEPSRGSGKLALERVGAATVLRTARASSPLRLLTPRNHGHGAWVFAAGLHPPHTATVIRDGVLTDGPFTEGKEHVGGFTLIEAPDLDAALAWGSRMAAILAPLAIEVRPVV